MPSSNTDAPGHRCIRTGHTQRHALSSKTCPGRHWIIRAQSGPGRGPGSGAGSSGTGPGTGNGRPGRGIGPGTGSGTGTGTGITPPPSFLLSGECL